MSSDPAMMALRGVRIVARVGEKRRLRRHRRVAAPPRRQQAGDSRSASRVLPSENHRPARRAHGEVAELEDDPTPTLVHVRVELKPKVGRGDERAASLRLKGPRRSCSRRFRVPAGAAWPPAVPAPRRRSPRPAPSRRRRRTPGGRPARSRDAGPPRRRSKRSTATTSSRAAGELSSGGVRRERNRAGDRPVLRAHPIRLARAPPRLIPEPAAAARGVSAPPPPPPPPPPPGVGGRCARRERVHPPRTARPRCAPPPRPSPRPRRRLHRGVRVRVRPIVALFAFFAAAVFVVAHRSPSSRPSSRTPFFRSPAALSPAAAATSPSFGGSAALGAAAGRRRRASAPPSSPGAGRDSRRRSRGASPRVGLRLEARPWQPSFRRALDRLCRTPGGRADERNH